MTIVAADRYIDHLGAALVGPGRAKRELLREAADHLEDATDAYVRAGYDEEAAAEMAVADFGSVDEIAPAYQPTLAVAASRRTAWMLLAALSIQPFLWDSGLSLAAESHTGAPDNWLYAVLNQGVEIGGGFVLVGAVIALLTTGIGSRWLTARRSAARVTAVFSLTAAATVPLAGITMTAMSSATAPSLWLLIALLLVAPLAAVALSARRTLAAC